MTVVPMSDAKKPRRAPKPSAGIEQNVAGVLARMRSDARIDVFSFDEMARAVMTMDAPPWRASDSETRDENFPRLARDVDATAVQEFLQNSGMPKIGFAPVMQAIERRAFERAYDPLADYFNGLEWSGAPRCEAFFPTYMGAADTPYNRAIGRMFWVSLAARALSPGCKADHMTVVEGAQGIGKSRTFAVIGGQYFSDALPDISNGKDVAQHLRGRLLIEISELSAMSRAENSALKAFLSRTDERYRPPYGRLEVIEPRRCVFVGTTNQSVYLRDETGGRRFWPVKVHRADVQLIERDRDQLFAEAVHLYRAGASWWPDAEFEAKFIKPEQDARFEVDAWQEIIARHLETTSKTTIASLAREALSIETPRIGTADQRRISAILERLGWCRDTKKDSRGNVSWVPPSS